MIERIRKKVLVPLLSLAVLAGCKESAKIDLPNMYTGSYVVEKSGGGCVEYKLTAHDKLRLNEMLARLKFGYELSNNAIITILELADSNENRVLETSEVNTLERKLYRW